MVCLVNHVKEIFRDQTKNNSFLTSHDAVNMFIYEGKKKAIFYVYSYQNN